MEIGNLHKSEAELKQQLATAVAQVQRSAQDWTVLKQKQEGATTLLCSMTPSFHDILPPTEFQIQGESAIAELKEEKLENKKLKGELQRTQDELSDTRTEKEGAEKVEGSV